MQKALIIFLLIYASKTCTAQFESGSRIKKYSVDIQADATDWTNTAIKINKGDRILFQVIGTVDLGNFTKNVSGTGSENPFLLGFNRYGLYNHGCLLAANNDKLIPSFEAEHLDQNLRMRNVSIPASLSEFLTSDAFIGNYFVAGSAQDLKFVVNDSKIDDNSNFFTVIVYILPFTRVPDLNGKFDLAKYVDVNDGNVPFCFDDDCLPIYGDAKNSSQGLWFYGRDAGGHYYLTINPVDMYDADISEAIRLLTNNIYYVFPGRAVDQQNKDNAERSEVIKNHKYDLVYKFMESDMFNENIFNSHLNIDVAPQVKAIDLSKYHFTFEANGSHLLRGTAIHGLFKDNCGKLYMFQQGRGVADEWGIQGEMNFPLAYYMWQGMAANLKQVLNK